MDNAIANLALPDEIALIALLDTSSVRSDALVRLLEYFKISNRILITNSLTACEDGCTGALFDEVDQMARSISRFDFNDYVPLPWTGLFYHQNTTVLLEQTLIERREEYQISDRLVNAPNILPLAQITLQRAKEMEEITIRFKNESADLQPICSETMDASIQIASVLEGIFRKLVDYF